MAHPRDKVSKGEYGRRPYVENYKTPYRDVQKRVPNKAIFDLKLEKQSEFVKPYLVPDYQAMEYHYPPPNTKFSMYDWNNLGGGGWGGSYPQPCCLPEFSGPIPEMYEEGWAGWYIHGCILDCFWAPSIIQTDDECAQGEYCCVFNPTFSKIVKAEFLEVDGREMFEVTEFDQEHVCFKFKSDPGTTTYPVTLRAYYHHQHGKTIRRGWCEDIIWPRCVVCDCETATPVTIDDDSTPDTIDPGGSISVYILDGCPPFSWEVAGTGYSFTNATTEDRVNTLNCVDGEGSCDSEYGPIATMTIVDDCGDTATSAVGNDRIRNTDGEWVDKVGLCEDVGGVSCNKYSTVAFYYISGYQRWKVWGYELCCTNPTHWADYSGDTCVPPCCGSPAECSEHTFCGSRYRSINWSRYYEWECPA